MRHRVVGARQDTTGVELPDRDSAIRYANDIVRELMRSREVETRSWCFEIYESGGDRLVCEIPFVSLDPSLDHLIPTLRTMVESISERKRLLSEVIHSVKGTVQESQALVARARGKPYLASKAVIRDI